MRGASLRDRNARALTPGDALGVAGSSNGNGLAATRPRIVVLLPRGETLRNFVYTGTLDELSRGSDLSILSVLPADGSVARLSGRSVEVRQLSECPERWPVRVLRDLLDLAHGRWLWSEAAKERWRLRDAEAATPYRRLQRTAKKLACYPFAHRAGLEALSKLERAASRWLRTTDEYLNLYRQLRPSLVFNASHVHSKIAIQAVQAAQWLGIPTATFIFSWDNLTSQGRVIPPYDYYLVWNQALREQLLGIYRSIRPESVFVTGTPQFDFHFRPEYRWSREEFCARVGADASRPLVLYSTGMANHMPGEPEIVEGIADTVASMAALGSPQLLVRVYPKDRTGRFDALKRRRTDILFPEVPWEEAWLTPKPEDCYLLANTLRHAAVGINVASTVSLELCMYDKPVLNVAYNPPSVDPAILSYARYYSFDHYKPVVDSGAVEVAYSPDELAGMLANALQCPERLSANRRQLVQGFFGDTLDGRSSHRVAQALLSMVRR